jgi:hypothetical protein
MKYLILVSSLLLTFIAQNAFAGKIDSVYADLCYQDGIYDVSKTDSAAMFKKPDGVYGKIAGNGPLIDMAFRKPDHINTQPIKGGSVILIWGKTDAGVDSSAGQITFNTFNGILVSSDPVILGDGLNIVPVPAGTWTYIELGLAAPLDAGSKNHAKSYLVDGVALVQDTTTPVKNVVLGGASMNALASYPNPFVTNTTIRFELETEGETELVVIDALGRETERINAGFEQSGVHEIPLALKSSGMYFVRLFVGGVPIGSPLKISAQ